MRKPIKLLLLVITDFAWIALLFPFWVLLVSTWILIADFHQVEWLVITRSILWPRCQQIP